MAFTFKQFHVEDDRCPMKTGTDAVLLGAWSDTAETDKILDMGTGCGIIALMLAQRSTAMIEAIDIDPTAASQAGENFRASPWSNRLKAYPLSLREFTGATSHRYDLVVSNPPFFTDSLRSPRADRNLARHNTSIGFDQLMYHSSLLLQPHGRCCFIIPVSAEKTLSDQAFLNNLYLRKKTEVIPKTGKAANRVLLEFTKRQIPNPEKSTILIRDQHGNYSDEYRDLTGDFYLQF